MKYLTALLGAGLLASCVSLIDDPSYSDLKISYRISSADSAMVRIYENMQEHLDLSSGWYNDSSEVSTDSIYDYAGLLEDVAEDVRYLDGLGLDSSELHESALMALDSIYGISELSESFFRSESSENGAESTPCWDTYDNAIENASLGLLAAMTGCLAAAQLAPACILGAGLIYLAITENAHSNFCDCWATNYSQSPPGC